MINDVVQEIIDTCGGSNDPTVVEMVRYAVANYGLACLMDSAVAKEAEAVCLMEEEIVEIRI